MGAELPVFGVMVMGMATSSREKKPCLEVSTQLLRRSRMSGSQACQNIGNIEPLRGETPKKKCYGGSYIDPVYIYSPECAKRAVCIIIEIMLWDARMRFNQRRCLLVPSTL